MMKGKKGWPPNKTGNTYKPLVDDRNAAHDKREADSKMVVNRIIDGAAEAAQFEKRKISDTLNNAKAGNVKTIKQGPKKGNR